MEMHKAEGPAVWRGTEQAQRDDWVVTLDGDDCADIYGAAERVRDRPFDSITKEDFPLARAAAKLAAVKEAIGRGRGFVMLRGLPVNADDPLLPTVYWGIGTHVGVAVSQSVSGDRLGHVYDRGTNDQVRYYTRGGPLEFHIDPVDATSLLCLRTALSGGASRVASVGAIHNVILEERPDLLEILYRGFHNSLRGHGLEAVSPERMPVFARGPNGVESNFLVGSIHQAATQGFPISQTDKDALEFVTEVASRPDIYLDMDFRSGDIQFLSNRTTMHARTDYVDHADPALKRHLLRLWFQMPDWQPRAAGREFFAAAPDRAGGGVRPRPA